MLNFQNTILGEGMYLPPSFENFWIFDVLRFLRCNLMLHFSVFTEVHLLIKHSLLKKKLWNFTCKGIFVLEKWGMEAHLFHPVFVWELNPLSLSLCLSYPTLWSRKGESWKLSAHYFQHLLIFPSSIFFTGFATFL